MTAITDEFMREMLAKTKPYCVVIVKAGPKLTESNAQAIIWEHGRRNFELRSEGKLAIVCAATGKGKLRGIAVFNTGFDEATRIMDGDPAVRQGVLEYEIHPCVSFPGDCLST